MADFEGSEVLSFNRDEHVRFFLDSLESLPAHYTSLDAARLTAVYFSVIGLDIMNEIDRVDKARICNFIYGLQLHEIRDETDNLCKECNAELPSSSSCSSSGHVLRHGGFIGSSYLGQPFRSDYQYPADPSSISSNSNSKAGKNDDPCSCIPFEYMQGHLAMAYTSLATLITLEDDLERLDKKALISSISELQQENGSFSATKVGTESDMRFLYCACAVSSFLNDFSGINIEKAISFIDSCITYEGGFALIENAEAQGGATYCAIASLILMNSLDKIPRQKIRNLMTWCNQRIHRGYNGRTNKVPDSCYSFWIGASLEMLNAFQDTNLDECVEFILRDCQLHKWNENGGFSKTPGDYPDILHTFYSISWLALRFGNNKQQQQEREQEGDANLNFKSIHAALGICICGPNVILS